jgi:hypothetical protein
MLFSLIADRRILDHKYSCTGGVKAAGSVSLASPLRYSWLSLSSRSHGRIFHWVLAFLDTQVLLHRWSDAAGSVCLASPLRYSWLSLSSRSHGRIVHWVLAFLPLFLPTAHKFSYPIHSNPPPHLLALRWWLMSFYSFWRKSMGVHFRG